MELLEYENPFLVIFVEHFLPELVYFSDHTQTMDIDDTYNMIYEWRKLLDDDFKDSPRYCFSVTKLFQKMLEYFDFPHSF